jgi:hypothetical protein
MRALRKPATAVCGVALQAGSADACEIHPSMQKIAAPKTAELKIAELEIRQPETREPEFAKLAR